MEQTSLTSLFGSIIEPAAVHQLVVRDVHADRAVTGRGRVDGHAALRGAGHDRILRAARPLRQQMAAEGVVELGGGNRPVEAAGDQEVADEAVGVEQHLRREQHVVDADDAFLVEHPVVHERRAAAQREVQGVVEVVIEIGAGADDEVDQPALHHRDDAAAEPGGRERPGNRQRDGGVVILLQHLVGEDAARFAQTRGVERLEPLVDQGPDGGRTRADGSSEWACRRENPCASSAGNLVHGTASP